MKLRKKRKATALIVSMIFMLIFSALAVSLATISDTNTQIADNLRKGAATNTIQIAEYLLKHELAAH